MAIEAIFNCRTTNIRPGMGRNLRYYLSYLPALIQVRLSVSRLLHYVPGRSSGGWNCLVSPALS